MDCREVAWLLTLLVIQTLLRRPFLLDSDRVLTFSLALRLGLAQTRAITVSFGYPTLTVMPTNLHGQSKGAFKCSACR